MARAGAAGAVRTADPPESALARDGLITRLALLDAAVTGANGTALLVGANFGRIADCEVEGRVQGRVAIGGVAGGNAGRIERVRARVDIAASAAVGGVVGDMNGVVADSHADVRIRADGKGVGGLVGLSTFGTLLRSAADGSVTGSDNVGGAVGVNTNALLAEVAGRVAGTASGTNAGGRFQLPEPRARWPRERPRAGHECRRQSRWSQCGRGGELFILTARSRVETPSMR